MALTLADLNALDFGYLSGADLTRFCPYQLLIQQQSIGIDFAQCLDTAKTDVISELSNQYDFTAEYLKSFPKIISPATTLSADLREKTVLMITIITTVRYILGSAAAMDERLRFWSERSDKFIEKIKTRSKKLNLPIAVNMQLANTKLVHARFTSETDYRGWANRY